MLTARRWLTMLATAVAGAVTLAPSAALPASAAPSAALPASAAAPMSAGEAAAPADFISEGQQWVLNMLDLPAAWDITKGAGVKVAVLDSGVDPGVTDLTGSVTPGPDLTHLKTATTNPHWGEHGTWMASIIAGHGHDGGGITGVAPEARILSIRVIPDKDDPGYNQYEAEPEQEIQQSLANGIMDAVRDGAQVVSMSIGYSSPSAQVRAAVQYAYSRGVVLVASSGNSGHDDERRGQQHYAPVSFPADYPGVISVGAVDKAGHAAGFTSNNLSVQIAAPGVRVPAQGRDDLYWTVDGTSPACALVAGVAALIEARYRHLPPAQVLQALTTTAKQGTPGGHYNALTGFGTVDAAAALAEAGKLVKIRASRSQVASSTRFGGGPAAIPPAPVSPRGISELVWFTILAILSLSLVVAASVWFAVGRPRTGGAHAAYAGPQGHAPQGNGPQGNGPQGRGPQGHAPQANGPQGNAPQGYRPPGYGAGSGSGSGYPNAPGYHAPSTEHGAQGDAWQQ